MITLYRLILGGLALVVVLSALYAIGMLLNIRAVEMTVGGLLAVSVLGVLAHGLGEAIDDWWRN